MEDYVSIRIPAKDEVVIEIPQSLDELNDKEIPMKMRQELFSTLSRLYNMLKVIEWELLFNGADISNKINEITTRLNKTKLKIECEICGEDSIVYKNICSSCFTVKQESICYELCVLGNLLTRFDFLKEQLSESLLNQLTNEQLKSISNEIAILSRI